MLHDRVASLRSNPMHILISALSRFTQPTGICRHAANLARCLNDLEEISEITLLVGQWQEAYFRDAFELHSSKIKVVPVKIANNSLARNRWFAFGLPNAVKQYQPNLVHLSFPLPIFRSRFACPIVATVHDLYPYHLPEDFGRFNGFCKRMFVRRCLNASDGVTCVSESTRKALEQRFPRLSSRVPVRLVHNYADFSPTADVAPPRSDPRPFLLAVAQHQRNKRLDLLLEAYARLRKDGRVNHDLQLFIVGSEGADTERLKRDAERWKLDGAVHWLPQLSDAELGWMYRNSKAFVASSSIEGFCLPLLEALVFNCNIVASDIPVFHEIAGDAPTYFDLQNDPVENLMEAILHVLDGPQGMHHYSSRFSRSQTASECAEFYSLLLPEMAVEGRHAPQLAPQAGFRQAQQASE